MKNISPMLARGIMLNALKNIGLKKPLAISFEITHSCNANCSHCDKNGIIKNENIAPPERFDEIYQELKPVFAQVSGGEPLLRDDYLDIVKLFRSHGTLPLVSFVSNAALMTPEKYLELTKAGVDQFSFSLDMPDERHDKNRAIPGLFNHLTDIVPKMTAMGYYNVAMISVIRKQSLPYLVDIAKKAMEWNASITFSSYTQLRTNSDEHSIKSEEDLKLLRQQIGALIEMRRNGAPIFNSEPVFKNMIKFFETNSIPNCKTGYRHHVVNPDGSFVPCAMHKVNFKTHQELVENFTKKNTCTACYVPLRANTELSVGDLWNGFGWPYIKERFSRAN